VRLLFIFTALFLFSAGAQAAAGLERHEIAHGGMAREYWIHDPRAGTAKTGKRPLILVLHGGGGRADKFDVMTGGENSFDRLADREDILVVYPQGHKKQWNDGRELPNVEAQSLNLDDVGFLSALIDLMVKSHGADPSRIYVTGPSNGGHMSNRLACEISDKVAAVGIVIASMPVLMSDKCRPKRQVSVLIMNGTDDPLVPYDGGMVKVLGRERGMDVSTAGTFGFWLRRAGFAGNPGDIKAEQLPDADPDDKTRVERQDYRGPAGTEVVLYTVRGGGHTWPGGRQYLFRGLVGRVSRDINATEVIWDFFKRNPKR
jgi:polyhydroxybutyrate depolymerase